MADEGVSVTWLGHATTLIRTPAGKTVLIDPWVQGNPAVPEGQKNIEQLDLMLITHGHFDHMGDAVTIAKLTSCEVICIVEIADYLAKQGVENVTGINIGGTVVWNGNTAITMVDAIHSSGITHDDGTIIYGGTAAGYVLRFENHFTVYHAGDTEVFDSMRLIGDLYSPDVALLPIGGHFTMGPRKAARALRLLGVGSVIPIHYGTFPILKGTPDELKQAARDIQGLKVLVLKPGETVRQRQMV
jgi:L-ascorbate metabolism protein UlaG (beta-lactamase superfamily)